MKYPKVDHAHIVPRHYLENFALDGMIGMRLLGETESKVISTRDAAVRTAFYRRNRPDGTPIDDAEWSLAQVEDATAGILRGVAEAWPLELDAKTRLAELFAFQLIRGPRWKDWHEDFTRGFVSDYEQRDDHSPTEIMDIRAVGQHLLTDTQRLGRMISMGVKVTAVFASMHWTLIDFASPVVVTSDHPVVMWPITERARAPQPTPMGAGVLETLEIRVPVSPHHAILMTWRDEADDQDCLVRGTRDHAANLNAFTIAQAERQWFHQPGAPTPTASGRLLPLPTQFFRDCGTDAAGRSQRRAATSANVQPMIGRDLRDRDIEVVTMSRKP